MLCYCHHLARVFKLRPGGTFHMACGFGFRFCVVYGSPKPGFCFCVEATVVSRHLRHFPLCFDLLRAITTRESRHRRVFLLRIPSQAEKCQRGLLAAFKWLNLVLFKESLGTPAIRTFKTRHTDGRVHSFQMQQKLQVTVFPANIIHVFVSFVASCY